MQRAPKILVIVIIHIIIEHTVYWLRFIFKVKSDNSINRN